MLKGHSATKLHGARGGQACEFAPSLGASNGVKVTVHHACNGRACGCVGARDANASEGVVLVNAATRVESAQLVEDVGRTHHADVEVVGLEHVLGHALDVLHRHGLQTLQVGLVVVVGQVVTLNVQGKTGHCAFVLQRTGKAAGHERFSGGELGTVHLRVANAVDLRHELDEGAVGDFRPNVGKGRELGGHRVRAERGACAVRVGFVFAQVLHQAAAKGTAAEDGIHQLDGRCVWMTGRERHRLRDVDGALNGPVDSCEADLVAGREFGRHDPRVRDVAAEPLAEMGVGLGVRFVRRDVAHHNQVGHVGAEVRLVVLDEVVARDLVEALLGHHFSVRVEGAKVGCGHEVGGDVAWRGWRVGQSRTHLLLHLFQFLFREGRVEDGVGDDAQEVAGVLAQRAGEKARGAGAEGGAEEFDFFGDLGLGARFRAGAHHVADDAREAGFVAF